MKRIVFYLVIFLFIFQGCAATTHITSKKGAVEIGMTKAEVLAIWGEPKIKHMFESDSRTYNRWELWRYPRINWWGAHTIDLVFNKDGILADIEPLYK